MSQTILTFVGADYPIEDVEAIGSFLTASEALVPGYDPPSVGLLALAGLIYAKNIDGIKTIILPDRNLASRMAKVAKEGLKTSSDTPSKIATYLMAFAQATDLEIEPSIAFHELAYEHGNASAHEELVWFRVADRAGARAWIDLALGRRSKLINGPPPQPSTEDLAFPLRRWNRNYIVALKIAELELRPTNNLQRALDLFDWMFEEFIFAGPAAVFATMYFSPMARRKRLIKQLRSSDRERAVNGVKNAAWDITHLSDFVSKTQQGIANNTNYIFATADRNLAASRGAC